MRRWDRRATSFNDVVDRFAACQPFAGLRILLEQTVGGYRVSLEQAEGWRHPWYTEASWNPEERRWEATVLAGFVNGLDPLIDGVSEDGTVSRLLDNPSMPLRGFRRLGNDQGDEAPRFFQLLGVKKNSAAPEQTDLGLSVDATDVPGREDELPTRYLVAVDFVISCARAALTSQVYVVDETGTSGQQVLYRVGFDGALVEERGSRARLYQAAKYEPPVKPTLLDRLLGTANDSPEDTKLVSTVYLLSPPLVGGEPDGSWTPYSAHSTFWNLKYAARNLVPKEPPAPITLFTGLIGGIGDALGNQILAQINEFSDRVSNALNAVTNEGQFWNV